MAYKAATIRKMIANLVTAADKLKVRTHKLAVVILNHYKEHGDTTLMAELVNELRGRGVARRALIQWFQRHGKVTLVVENGEIKFTKRKGVDHTATDVDKADASPFYDDDAVDGQTADDLKTFNFWGQIRGRLKKAKEIKAAVDEVLNANEGMTIEAAMKRAGFDPDKTKLPSQDEIDKVEGFIETYGNLDKPQPKSDKTLFDKSKTTNDPELKVA